MEGFGKGLLRGLKEHDTYTPGGNVDVEVPEGVAFVLGHPAVSQYPVVKYRVAHRTGWRSFGPDPAE